MSLHYEWILAFNVRPDLPQEQLHELRWHLGLEDSPSPVTTLDSNCPIFGLREVGRMPGGQIASLRESESQGDRSLGLFLRTVELDDAFYELLPAALIWFAGISATQGWIGMAREEMALDIWMHFYVQAGHAYVSGQGKAPEALESSSPPFTLTYTNW